MITVRKSCGRGRADHGWLKSFHSFSFADYLDPRHMGVGNLRVLNDDRIAPGTGFGLHGHCNLEIVTYVVSGELGHADHVGHATSAVPGDVLRMSAGRGICHREFNAARCGEARYLQAWLVPHTRDIEPGYEQKHFDTACRRGRLRLVASPDGRDASATLCADASMYAGLFDGSEASEQPLDAGRWTHVHLVRGRLEVNGRALEAGDAATLLSEERLVLARGQAAEVVVFDLGA